MNETVSSSGTVCNNDEGQLSPNMLSSRPMQSSSLKPLNELEASILQVIEDGGVIRGNVLRRRARVKDMGAFGKAVQKLVKLELIAASGNMWDPKSALAAHYRPVPSRRRLAQLAVKGDFET